MRRFETRNEIFQRNDIFINQEVEATISAMEALKQQVSPLNEQLSQASASLTGACQSMKKIGSSMVCQGEVISKSPTTELIGKWFMTVGNQIKQTHELLSAMTQNTTLFFGNKLETMLSTEMQEIQECRKSILLSSQTSKRLKRRSISKRDLMGDITKNASEVGNLATLVSKTEQHWNKEIIEGLLSVSSSIGQLFENGQQLIKPDEIVRGRDSLVSKLASCNQRRRQDSENSIELPEFSSNTSVSDRKSLLRRTISLQGSALQADVSLKKSMFRQNVKEKNRKDKLHEILRKLLLRESYYNRRLKIIINNFMAPLSDEMWAGKIKPEESDKIFRNILEISTLHDVILEELKDYKTKWATMANPGLISLLCSIVERFSVYVPFVSGEDTANLTLQNCYRRSKNLMGFINVSDHPIEKIELRNSGKTCQQKDLSEESLIDLLTYPTQTLKNYKGTLEQVMVLIIGPQEAEAFETSFSALKEYEEQIKIARENAARELKIESIQENIVGIPHSIIIPEREYLGSEHVDDTTELRKVKSALFLFNDLVIVAKRGKSRVLSSHQDPFIFVKEIKLYRTSLFNEEGNQMTLQEREHADYETNHCFNFQSPTKKARFITTLKSAFTFVNSRKIFCISLKDLMATKRERKNVVPSIVTKTIAEMTARSSYLTEGFLRISGKSTKILCFFDNVNQGEEIKFDSLDDHTVGGIFKLFFRKLPEPLLTYFLFEKFHDAHSIQDITERVATYKKLIESLPLVHQNTLSAACAFFDLLASHSATNKMTARNISIVMAPVLLYENTNDLLATASRQGTSNSVIEDIIQHNKAIFNACPP